MGIMKRTTTLAVAAVLVTVLAGCGGGTAMTTAGSATASAESDQTKIVPDVTGKSFPTANNLLNKEGLSAVAYGKDGKEWKTQFPEDANVLSTDPAAGTSTDKKLIRLNVDMNETDQAKTAKAAAAKAEADAEKARLAERYDFTCDSTVGAVDNTFKTFQQVWASDYYSNATGPCTVRLEGKDHYDDVPPTLLPSENAIVAVVKANGGDVSDPVASFINVLSMCAKVGADYADDVWAVPASRKANAQAALKLCPKAPHAKLFKEALTAVKITDGNYTVGKDMQPGTYQTKPSIKDCYWSRNTGGGATIENDFVGFAPNGVTVTTYAGEGFESSRCGVWTKIG